MTTTEMLVFGALFVVGFGKGLVREAIDVVGFPCWVCRRGWAWSFAPTRHMKPSFDFDANPNALRDFQKNRTTYFTCGRCRAAWTYSEAQGWKRDKQ